MERKINPIKLLQLGAITLGAAALYPIVKDSEGDIIRTSEISDKINVVFGFNGVFVCEAQFIDRRYREITVKGETNILTSDTPRFGFNEITTQISVLYNTLCLYPQELYLNSHKTQLFLASNLKNEIRSKDGLGHKSLNGQVRIPDDNGMLICLNLDSAHDISEIYHHEFFHTISDPNIWYDFINTNQKYGLNDYPFDYPPSFENLVCEITNISPDGSSSCYGSSNPNEDAAEIARRLMMGDRNFWREFEGSLNTDNTPNRDNALKDKVDIVIKHFDKITNGKMDYRFFFNLAQGILPNWGWPSLT